MVNDSSGQSSGADSDGPILPPRTSSPLEEAAAKGDLPNGEGQGAENPPAEKPEEKPAVPEPPPAYPQNPEPSPPGENQPGEGQKIEAAQPGPTPTAETEQEPQTADTLDTDEFLGKILEEKNGKGENNKTVSGGGDESLASEGAPANEPAGPGQEVSTSPPAPETPVPTYNDLPLVETPEKEPPKVSDDLGGLDGLVGKKDEPTDLSQGQGETPASSPAPAEPPAGSSPQVPSQGKPPASGGTIKLVGLVVAAVIVVGGGYFAYNSLFGASKTSKTAQEGTTGTVSDLTGESTGSTSQALANDKMRKSNLGLIQEALKNYYAANGKYPLAEKLEPLNEPGNILEKELVSAGYIKEIPLDPDSSRYYGYKSDSKTFTLSAVLDDLADAGVTVKDGLAIFEVKPETVIGSSSATSDILTGETQQGTSDVEANSSSQSQLPSSLPTVVK